MAGDRHGGGWHLRRLGGRGHAPAGKGPVPGRSRRRFAGIIAAALVALVMGPEASTDPVRESGCTAFAFRDGGRTLVGKNLDWPVGLGAVLINPRGLAKTAWVAPSDEPARWVSRFASVTFTQFGREFPLGGMNEAGLVVEELSYWPARYAPPDRRPAVNELQWIQYLLDRHGTVGEALADDAVRIAGFRFGLHYFIADATGLAAVVELLDGRRVVHAGGDLPAAVLANDTYERSARYLRHHVGFGGTRVPGAGPESPERFVRAALRLRQLESTGPHPAAVDSAFSVLEAVGQQDTQWSIVYDAGARTVRYRTRRDARVRTVRLGDVRGACADGVTGRSVDASGRDAGGWDRWSHASNRHLLTAAWRALATAEDIEPPPAHVQEAMAEYPREIRCADGS